MPSSPQSIARRTCSLAIAAAISFSALALGAQASDVESNSLAALGLPPLEAAHATEEAKLAKLGALLFADTRLSASGNISCATCHVPDKAFADGRALAVGNAGQTTTRNAPSLWNVAFEKHLFWDGRVQSLEDQAVAPLVNPNEHALADERAVISIIRGIPTYALEFEALRSGSRRETTLADVGTALAAFERTLIAGGSAFDLYLYGGRPQALSDSAVRGLNIFRGRGQCANCHTIEEKYAMFSDGGFHASGRLPKSAIDNLSSLTKRLVSVSADRAARELLVSSDASIASLGRFIATLDPDDIAKFKTPSLRNVALTAPYMHDGSVATLAEAIDRELYTRTSAGNYPIALTLAERADLRAFLDALTSPEVSR